MNDPTGAASTGGCDCGWLNPETSNEEWMDATRPEGAMSPEFADFIESSYAFYTYAQQQRDRAARPAPFSSWEDVQTYIQVALSANLPEVLITALRDGNLPSWWGETGLFLNGQQGGVGWEAWAGTTSVYSWGLREFYYGPKVQGLAQYYGQSESVRLNASRTRNSITARTQRLTPQPLRSLAQGTKVWQVNPNGNFAKPNSGVMWKMRGVGLGGGVLIGYGIYNSAANISSAAAQGYGTQAAINEGFSWGGAIAGGAAGAEGGAYVGAAIGVWFGGAGAAPGAVIGGFIGGLGGSIIGGTAGYWTGSQITGY